MFKKTNLGIDYGLALRLVIGWTYFSALWRRLVLTYKLDPDLPNYLGIKFNHFLPNAILIQDAIEFFVSHPELLWWKLLIFTIVEGVFGLFMMLGFITRITAVVTMFLAFGILLGAGWFGTTCLDEWQIGILGMAGGFVVLLLGPGKYSLDNLFKDRCFYTKLTKFNFNINNKLVLVGSLIVFLIALSTNQIFHGGVWGSLHNKSVSPELKITQVSNKNNII